MWTDQRYRIRINCVLSPDWSDWFGSVMIDTDESGCWIEGVFADQAALIGTLNRLHDLNIAVILVERI